MERKMKDILSNMQEDLWIDSSFMDELLEFTKSNTIRRERKVQQARSRGATQKEVDKERKSVDRDQKRVQDTTNPWKSVVIVRTNQDGKTRLIPSTDFDGSRHELLYGLVPGQAPKPEVTPNVARQVATQDDFEASKTSNRLLGIIPRKKQPDQEVIRSDEYDYPKDGVQRLDPSSTYPDWDHAPDTLPQGIELVASTAMGKEVNVDMIQGLFGKSQTLMDASIRSFQQISDFVRAPFMVATPDESYDTTMEWSNGAPTLQPPVTDLIIQTQTGTIYTVAIIEDKTKVITDPETKELFEYSLNKVGADLEEEESTKKQFKELKEKIEKFLSKTNAPNISKKYRVANLEDMKIEVIADLESILESSAIFEKMIVVEGLSGIERFGVGTPGAANTLMSVSRDGTNLKLVPLDETRIKRLLGETRIKIKLTEKPGEESPFDQMLLMMDEKDKDVPELSEFFDLAEDISDAKRLYNEVMNSSPSMLMNFFILLNVYPETIVIENVNLDAVGSISGGNFTKVRVNNKNYYIQVEKDTNFYDKSAIRLPQPPPQPAPMMAPPPMEGGGAPLPVQEDYDLITEKKRRDYKEEYRKYHSKKKQKKRRAGRNKIRRKYVKKYGKHKLRGKDVDHKDHNPLNNGSDNVQLRDVSSNRGDNKVPVREEHGAGEEGTLDLLLNYLMGTPGQGPQVANQFIQRGKAYAAKRKQQEDRYRNK